MSSGFEIGTAYVHILPSTDGIQSNLESALNGEAGNAGTSAGQSLGSNLISKVKTLIAAAGIGAAIKASLDAGGALQQSFGGLETLYGEASTAMKQYAQDAAAVGISANDYAEQATSFGASLKQAFGGDVTAAAQSANQAIIDMADNSSKFGTDIESIQNAYQGFSKQNYTMLDNLKLGYGGTKSEMERLLADAEELSGQTYSIDNLGDVYEAIHVIQEDLGVAGNAAAEASETFTGSFDAMKASATNLMAALSSGEMDVGPQMQTLVSSASAFLFNNLIPMVINIGMQLPEALVAGIQTAIPILQEQASSLLTALMSFLNDGGFQQMLDTGVSMVQNLMSGFSESFPQIMESAGDIISNLLTGIMDNLPAITSAGWDILTSVVTGIVNALPSILSAAAKIILTFYNGLLNNYPKIISAASQGVAKFISGVGQALPGVLSAGGKIIGQLVSGILNMVSRLPAAARSCISSFKSAFTSVNWASLGSNIISGIARGISSAAGSITSSLKSLAQNALSAAKNVLGIHSPSRRFRDEVGKWIPLGIAAGITENASSVFSAISDVSDGAISAATVKNAVGNKSRLSATSTSNSKVIQLLEEIAEKNMTVSIGNRDFTRCLEDVGVQFT